jgi:hypothetical protein
MVLAEPLHDLPGAALRDSTQQAIYLRYNFVETKFFEKLKFFTNFVK